MSALDYSKRETLHVYVEHNYKSKGVFRDVTSDTKIGGLTFGPDRVRLIRVSLVLVNLNAINDTYIHT